MLTLSLMTATAGSVAEESPSPPVVKTTQTVGKYSTATQLVAMMAALSLTELAVDSPESYSDQLSDTDLDNAESIVSKTGDGRDYALVVFRFKSKREHGGFVIYQVCRHGRLVRERGFMADVDRLLVKPFVEGAKTNAMEYYATDECKRFDDID